MERQQHQHGASQPQSSVSRRSSQPIRRKSKAAFSLGKPMWNASLVILGGAWVVVVVISLTAISGLLSPNMSSQQPLGTASVRDTALTGRATTTARADSQSHIPLWLFGAIALSCATGSILISKQVSRSPRSHRSIKPKRLASYVPPEAVEPPYLTVPSQPHFVAEPSFALAPHPLQHLPSAAPFMAPATLMQLAHQVSQATGQTTDVPASVPEAKKPLDWGEASLADKLDLRKPRSSSSLL